jgi:peptide/nickel transport system permease protein
VGLLLALALLGPLLAPSDPNATGDPLADALVPPGSRFLLGSDDIGRDLLSRLLYGLRISLGIGVAAAAVSVGLGTLVGALAGFRGAWTDAILMRSVDFLLAFPRLVLLLGAVAFLDRSVSLVVAILGLTGWMGTARLVRAQVLSLRHREFVEAGRAMGLGEARLLLRHVLPNCLGVLLVSATLAVGSSMLVEASLSFLGLGVPPPTPSIGSMLAEGRGFLASAPWISTFPGLTIALAVMAFNGLGEGLRRSFDPGPGRSR